MRDSQYAKYPDLQLSQHIFNITNGYCPQSRAQASFKVLQNTIKEQRMAPLYRFLAHPVEGIFNNPGEGITARQNRHIHVLNEPSDASRKMNFPWDENYYQSLKRQNEAELEAIQKEEDEATEKAGEMEIQTARANRAEFWTRVGDKDQALAAYELLFEKTGVLGTKIDIVLAIIRIGFFFADNFLVKKNVERASALVESGGDWDRRNRLKAYQGIHLLTTRSYSLAAPFLLDSLSTFTSYELCNYSSIVIYAIIAGSVSLKRVDFKAKVVDAPEIKAIMGGGEAKISALTGTISSGPSAGDEDMRVIPNIGNKPAPKAVNLTTLGQSSTDQQDDEAQINFTPLADLVSNLYNCNYKPFFIALGQVEESFLNHDRYLFEHRSWFVREMRLRGYLQFLQSYKVVGLANMANDFGLSEDFFDRDLAIFIAAGRVPCMIDRTRGIIETNRADDKISQYKSCFKQGDRLFTKLQRYSQAVRLRGSERG